MRKKKKKKKKKFGFRPGLTQTGLNSHRRWLEPGNFRLSKKRNCTIRVAKAKALICFAVTAKLICAFVFAYADCWFSHASAQIASTIGRQQIINVQFVAYLY